MEGRRVGWLAGAVLSEGGWVRQAAEQSCVAAELAWAVVPLSAGACLPVQFACCSLSERRGQARQGKGRQGKGTRLRPRSIIRFAALFPHRSAHCLTVQSSASPHSHPLGRPLSQQPCLKQPASTYASLGPSGRQPSAEQGTTKHRLDTLGLCRTRKMPLPSQPFAPAHDTVRNMSRSKTT